MKHILTLAVILLFSFVSFAQDRTVSGTVTDENNSPMPGVNIIIKGTSDGTTTDIDGNYKVNVGQESVLRFSFIGYSTVEYPVNSRSVLDVQLEPNFESLSEVVVVGYGSTTKKELTGAVVKVDGSKIEERNVPRIDQALQGQLAGVKISTNSGAPGGSSNISIRGVSTNGNNSPLIVVDGIIYEADGLNALNPNDVESINVLKDGTAGIYGVRAANGVIIIETKKGKKNTKPSLNFSGYYGVQRTAKKLDLLNATEYAILKNEAFVAGNQTPPFNNTNLGEGTDWQDLVFRDAPIQNYNLSVSGGTDKTTYNVGGSYFGQEGIVGGEKAFFERYNARVNFTTEILPKLKLTNVLLYTNEYSKTIPQGGIGSVLYNATNAYPTEPLRTDGRYSYLINVADIINPVAQLENTYNDTRVNKLVGKQELTYDITDKLSANARIGYTYSLVDFKQFNPLVWYGNGKNQNSAINENLDPRTTLIGEQVGGVLLERGASVTESRTTYLDYLFEGFVNYETQIGSLHNIKSTVGLSLNETSFQSLSGTAFNIPNNSLDLADISTNQAVSGYLNQVSSGQNVDRLNSLFLRGEYDYGKKYLFSGIIRRDGSTRFGSNNRFGYFGSLSGAWVLSDESFFNVDAIDFAKLRVSHGWSGNDRIQPYVYRANLGGEAQYVFDNTIVNGVAIGIAPNPSLQWESTQQSNIGLDLSLFNSIDIGANYFIKTTQNLLIQAQASAILGTYGPGSAPPFVNAGTVQNRGVELDFNYEFRPTDDFSLNVNYNFTYLQNEVTELPAGTDFLPGVGFGVGGNTATRFEAGFPVGYFIGFETDGIWQTAEEIASSPVVQPEAQPGDLKFVDQNGDGVISFGDNSDRTMLGSPNPDFIMGLNLNARFKGFDLTANITSVIGNEIIRNYERQQPYANQLAYNINRWTGEGSTNEYPRLTTGRTRNNEFSDFYVEDGSFVRVRNIQVGYNLPSNICERMNMTSMRIYIGSLNPFTLTKYMGYDPDISSANPLARGVDYGQYPQAKSLMGGFNIKF
ncbi:TonB-dependent receptor [Marivirga sp.]|uniref:SusC/RagA family TonB-linked outer membrane protein n=1 Tax=Marivirga sp. TaxID=2018662 RepID=UPI002D80F7FC|nr:TonB-dependent receptor [Marivirga sp.]HET8859198.1 TonB-dependent receptor [Marivirga sp.]